MNNILIVADPAETCVAIPRGLELARKLGLGAEVVAFVYAPLKTLNVSASEQGRIKTRLLQERESVVRAHLTRHGAAEAGTGLKVIWEKNVEQWLLRQCASGRYVGLVKGVGGAPTVVHASTDWQLLRKCNLPVLLVAKKRWHRTKPVLVTLDLGTRVRSKRALNEKVLGMARQLADALEVELKIVTVIEIPTLLSDLDLIDPLAYVRDARAEMAPRIDKLARQFGIPPENFYCKHGPVEKVITSYAARVRAQIVVMGTVARKGVKARLIGNTAERVLQHLKTDVLAIKP